MQLDCRDFESDLDQMIDKIFKAGLKYEQKQIYWTSAGAKKEMRASLSLK